MLTEVAYCGLYCGLCAGRTRIPQEAARLRAALRQEGYDQGYFGVLGLREVFPEFWQGLNCLADSPCPGCRAGGGIPGCPIRDCVQERAVDACPLCADFPCERLAMLGHYPTFESDGRRMQAIGLEAWIAEQEARAAAGFVYADIRHPA